MRASQTHYIENKLISLMEYEHQQDERGSQYLH
jgi:hypothetical protein